MTNLLLISDIHNKLIVLAVCFLFITLVHLTVVYNGIMAIGSHYNYITSHWFNFDNTISYVKHTT